MGNAQAVPVIGEIATVAEGAGKTVAAGCCAIFGKKKAASELLESAGQSFVNYSEVNCITANIHMVVAKIANDDEKVDKLCKKQAEAWDGLATSTPLIGHAKGIVHYAMGDHEKGEECMISASRTTAVMGTIALTGGAGAVVCGAAAVGAGLWRMEPQRRSIRLQSESTDRLDLLMWRRKPLSPVAMQSVCLIVSQYLWVTLSLAL